MQPPVGNKNDGKNKGLKEILNALEQTLPGSHLIMVYPELGLLRAIYSNYVKQELDNNNIVLVLPYYEHVRDVNIVLSDVGGIDVDYHLNEGSLVVIDAYEAFFGHKVEAGEGVGQSENNSGNIVSLMRIMRTQASKLKKDGITILLDLGCLFTDGNVNYLLKYEKSIPQMFKEDGLKQICLYNQRDFDSRFSDSDKAYLLDQHGRSVLMLDNFTQ
jgi:hypothetical protein